MNKRFRGGSVPDGTKFKGHGGQVQVEKQPTHVDGIPLLRTTADRRIAVCTCGWNGPWRFKREDAVADLKAHVGLGNAILDTAAELVALRRMLEVEKAKLADAETEGADKTARVFRDSGDDVETVN